MSIPEGPIGFDSPEWLTHRAESMEAFVRTNQSLAQGSDPVKRDALVRVMESARALRKEAARG